MSAEIVRIAPVFVVSDVKAAIDWYARALGFSVRYVNGEDGDDTGASWNYAVLHNCDVEIHLCKTNASDATLSSPANCYVFVRNIQSLYGHLSALEADVTPLEAMPWGNVECWLHDPYGNRIVLSAPQ